MAEITYNYIWDSGSLGAVPEIDGKQDYVVVVNWRYRGTCPDSRDVNNDIMVDQYGQQSFQVNPDHGNYIPYDELTPDVVIGWLNLDETAMQEAIAKQIESILNPPIVYPPIPWDNSSNA